MPNVSPPIANPVALLDALDARAIERRLDELHDEEAALRVLLRSLRARDRQKAKTAEETGLGENRA
jgi:hypothetical protein